MKESIMKNLGIPKKLAIPRSLKNVVIIRNIIFFIPASWVKHIHDEIKKKLLLGGNNLIDEIKDEKPNLSIKIIFLKVIHKNELFRIKVHNNILISLLKNYLKNYFEITKD